MASDSAGVQAEAGRREEAASLAEAVAPAEAGDVELRRWGRIWRPRWSPRGLATRREWRGSAKAVIAWDGWNDSHHSCAALLCCTEVQGWSSAKTELGPIKFLLLFRLDKAGHFFCAIRYWLINLRL